MTEDGDFYRELKVKSKEKRNSNLDKSRQLLIDRGVNFIERDSGHFIIRTKDFKIIDFWATTGKYIHREGAKYGRGVFNLIKSL